MLHGNLKVLTKESEIQKRILIAIRDHINNKISVIEKGISEKAQSLILESLNSSHETQDIISGKLRKELGITNPSSQLNHIFQAISNTVRVRIQRARRAGKVVRMKLTLEAVPIDLSAFNSIGSYTTEKGSVIPWFEWLTSLGDRIIIREYETEVGHPDSSRTGDMIMIQGKGWRIPPEYSGTPTNNFVTRATDQILPILSKKIEESFKEVI